MSLCKKCSGNGYVDRYLASSATFTPSIQQCPERCNISGYSKEVQRRLNNPSYVTESPVLPNRPAERAHAAVIPFRPKDGERK